MRPAKNSILYFIADVSTSLVGFISTLYFARVLGSEPLGEYFVVIALIGWLTIPTDGVASAINKRISEGGDDDTLLTAGVSLSAVYGVGLGAILILAQQQINSYVGTDVSVLLAGLLLTNICFKIVVDAIAGQKKIASAGFLRTGERILRVTSQVTLVYLGYRVIGLVGGHVVALAGGVAIGFLIFGLRPQIPDKKTLRTLLSYGRYAWLGNMKSKTFGWMDTLVLGLFVSSGLIGIYEISWRLASILILVSNAVETALFPEISEISSSGEYGEVRELLSEAIFYAGIFIIPGFFGTLVLGSDILRIYGTEFVAGAPILLILIVARTINVYEMQMLNVINGVDRPDVAFRINLVFIGVNVTLNFLLIWQFGWYGAAVATTVSSVVMLVLSYRAIDELMGVPSLPLAGIGKQILAAGGMAATVFVTQRALPFENMYATVGLVFFGAACYGIYLYVLSKRIRTKLRSLTAELSLS